VPKKSQGEQRLTPLCLLLNFLLFILVPIGLSQKVKTEVVLVDDFFVAESGGEKTFYISISSAPSRIEVLAPIN
jgi:hypothetical protein